METPNVIDAASEGFIVTNASKWKSGAAAMNYISLLLTPVFAYLQVKYPDLVFSEDVKMIIYQVILSAILGINVWISKITTKKPVSISELVK